jgi:hypothetical protein
MTAPVWTTPVGFLGTLTERLTTSISLQAVGTDIGYSLITGNLPPGLFLNTSTGVISGTPYSVSTVQTSNFVIRAKNADGVSDRTFSLSVTGPTSPTWATAEGVLPAGLNGAYYVINKEYVDYTVRADTDILASGNTLKYYIADQDGELPPGLTLSLSGRISGYVNDNLKLDSSVSLNGGYDEESYDNYPYDHSIINVNVVELVKPESIDRTYQFYITVTDGVSSSKRLFNMTIIDPNSLRADNTYIHSDTRQYDISASYLIAPIWQNNFGGLLPNVANLGTIRSGRGQVISLYDYDPYPFVGPVTWDWSTTVNPEIYIVTDSQYDAASFPTKNLQGDSVIYFTGAKVFPVKGMKIRLDEYIPGFDSTTYTVLGVVPTGTTSGFINLDLPLVQEIPDSQVVYLGTESQHPPGLKLDPVTGQLHGHLSYQPAYSKSYRFTISIIKTDTQRQTPVVAKQIFILTIKGDIDSYIQFVTTGSLGTVVPGQICELSVVAKNVNADYNLEYDLVSGVLPKGLTLANDGTIQGKVDYRSQTYFDFTSNGFDSFTLDSGSTTIDQNWYFTVRASDVYKLSAVDQQCYITVKETSLTEYTRVYVKPFLASADRITYRNFVSDPVTFDSALLYRPNDPEFGVQPQIKMVIETGIEKVNINLYASAMQQYFHRKRFYFGDIKSITAEDSNGKAVYELIYVDIIDNQMVGSNSVLTATSVGNMQKQLDGIQINSQTISVDETLLPKYMTTLQANTGVPLGFIKAVPICYLLPGNSSKVLSRIRDSKFDFKQFNFDTDRIIIETPAEATQNGWLYYPTS